MKLHRAVQEGDIPAMTAAYERGWNQLTTQHYSQSEWPSDDLIAPLVNNGESSSSPARPTETLLTCRLGCAADQIFLALYREL